MDRSLESLSSQFRPLVVEVLARLVERGIAVMIIQTSRTEAEHQQNLASGASKTAKTRHFPRSLRGLGTGGPDDTKCDAIDLCPYSVYQLAGPDKLHWATTDTPEAKVAWAAIGEEGEKLGLRWGGRWRDPSDPGHLELILTTAFSEGARPL